MAILRIDHVLLAMPGKEEEKACTFYRDVLGLAELPKPANLARLGGVWFGNEMVKVHLGVEDPFQPARKAHPAFRVSGLDDLRRKCESAGYATADDEQIEGQRRFFVNDPFGNRIEFLEWID